MGTKFIYLITLKLIYINSLTLLDDLILLITATTSILTTELAYLF
jgi:hypothetical protein